MHCCLGIKFSYVLCFRFCKATFLEIGMQVTAYLGPGLSGRLSLTFAARFVFQESDLDRLTRKREAELKYQKEENELDISKTKQMANIETDKFQNMVSAIGADTIQAIATSGPEMQVSVFACLSICLFVCLLVCPLST